MLGPVRLPRIAGPFLLPNDLRHLFDGPERDARIEADWELVREDWEDAQPVTVRVRVEGGPVLWERG